MTKCNGEHDTCVMHGLADQIAETKLGIACGKKPYSELFQLFLKRQGLLSICKRDCNFIDLHKVKAS